MPFYGTQWVLWRWLQKIENYLLQDWEIHLVHVKLWPAVHCLGCLSFNRQVDIMNGDGHTFCHSRTGPVLSELRITLEPLSQSHGSPGANCRPWRREGEQRRREFRENFCFPGTLMKLALVSLGGIIAQTGVTCVTWPCDCCAVRWVRALSLGSHEGDDRRAEAEREEDHEYGDSFTYSPRLWEIREELPHRQSAALGGAILFLILAQLRWTNRWVLQGSTDRPPQENLGPSACCLRGPESEL